jgi:hypothetical protein
MLGAFGLLNRNGHSAIHWLNRPAVTRNWLKKTNWPSGVTGDPGFHSTWILRPCVSTASKPVPAAPPPGRTASTPSTTG